MSAPPPPAPGPGPRPVIVYVLSTYPFGTGEPFVRPEVDWLQANGADVVLVPTRPVGARRPDDEVPPGVRVLEEPLLSPRVAAGALRRLARSPVAVLLAVGRLLAAGPLAVRLKNLLAVPKALWLAGRLERIGATHVHAYWASTPATVAMLAAELAHVPWSFTGHRWELVVPNALERKVASAAFARITSTEGLRRVVAHLDGATPPNLFVALTGIEVPAEPRPAKGPGPATILCPALLIERKDHATLLRAFADAVARGADATLALAGSGPSEEALRGLASTLGIAERVQFLGQVDRAELLAMYDRGEVDVVALTSLDEGLPFGLLEPMARGIPVIGTDVGGIGELLAGGGGLLVGPQRPDEVAAAIVSLVQDEERRAQVGAAARRTIEERFNRATQGQHLLDLFRGVAAP